MSAAKRGIRGRTPWPAAGSPEDPREELCDRQELTYTCDRGHTFEVVFAASAKAPATWECRCGRPAGLGQAPAAESELQRCMAKVRQRRNDGELEQLLADRLSERRTA